MENREMGIGWPLGLRSMYVRLRTVESFPVAVPEPRFRYAQSSSFSSFSSSSNLDTESTVSFFQDNSKSLGRLIGIRTRNRRSDLYSRNSDGGRSEMTQKLSTRSCSEHQDEYEMEMCDGICMPICLVRKVKTRKDS